MDWSLLRHLAYWFPLLAFPSTSCLSPLCTPAKKVSVLKVFTGPSLSADVMGMLLNPCIPVNALVFPIVCVAGSARDGERHGSDYNSLRLSLTR